MYLRNEDPKLGRLQVKGQHYIILNIFIDHSTIIALNHVNKSNYTFR